MRFKMIIAVSLGLLGAQLHAQESGFTNDLLPEKVKTAEAFFPMSKGYFTAAVAYLDSADFAGRINTFRSTMLRQINRGKDKATQKMQQADLDIYIRSLWNNYRRNYGADSLAWQRYEQIAESDKANPRYHILLDSAYQQVYVKKLSPQQQLTYDTLVYGKPGLNNAAIYKRSESYRSFFNGYLGYLKSSKYKGSFPYDFSKRFMQLLEVVANEIQDPFIREHQLYSLTIKNIKSDADSADKAASYHRFMATSDNEAYKQELHQLYTSKKVKAGEQSPDFDCVNINDEKVSLASLQGNYVYIDIWATWCAPCKAEIPYLTKLEEHYKTSNISFVSISVDQPASKAVWRDYVVTHQLKGIQLMAPNAFKSSFTSQYSVYAIPRFILIDPQGKIISPDAKRPSDPELKQELDHLLRSSK